MKRFMIWSAVLLLVVLGIAIARADARPWHRWADQGWHHRSPLGYVARELNLSDAQESQIKSIWQAERPTFSAVIHEFAAEAREMETVTLQGNMEEGKVQAIAARQGATIAKILIEKEQMKSKIYNTVLTPEQRIKADDLQKRWLSRLDRVSARIEREGNSESHN